jgi:hypothetical protein
MKTKIIIEGNLDKIDNNIIKKALSRAFDLKESTIIKGKNKWDLEVKITKSITKIKIYEKYLK